MKLLSKDSKFEKLAKLFLYICYEDGANLRIPSEITTPVMALATSDKFGICQIQLKRTKEKLFPKQLVDISNWGIVAQAHLQFLLSFEVILYQ